MINRKTLMVSLLGIVAAIFYHSGISAFDVSNSLSNLTESSAVKKLNLRNINDRGAIQSDRKLEESPQVYNFSKNSIGLVVARKDWMGKVPDNTTFAALSLPGTHNSMSFQSYDLELAHCQSITLQGQLQSGIRALDIRCRHIDNACVIHHGPIYLDASLDDVFQVILFFFFHHPKEAIFMRIKGDEEKPFNNTRTWDETLAAYKVKYEAFIWNGDIKSGTIPTLNDIRGKIIISDTTTSSWGNLFRVQDDFKVNTMWNLYDKWSGVKDQLQLSTAAGQGGNGNTLFVNFLSGVSPFGLVNPWFVASGHDNSRVDSDFRNTGVLSATDLWPDFPRRDCTANSMCSIFFKGINYLFYDHVKAAKKASSVSQHLGIVYADFPGKDLIELIIQQNM